MNLDPTAVVTAVANVVLVFVTWLYLRQLDSGYSRSIEPHLQWQDPRRAANPRGGNVAEFSVVVTNFGLGVARLTRAEVISSTGDPLAFRELRVPSTLPSGTPYTFHIDYANFTTAFINNAEIRITMRFEYTDVESRCCYRTEVTVNGKQDLHGAAEGPIDFFALDERRARERRVPCRPSPWSRLREWASRRLQ